MGLQDCAVEFKEEAEQKFKLSSSMKCVCDFNVEEVNEVDGKEIRVDKAIEPKREIAICVFNGLDVVRFSCPICKSFIGLTYKYCPECGTKIKWRDTDE